MVQTVRMTQSFAALLGVGFLLGWSVAWPPGPINAEVARRCAARGFWAGFSVLLGACAGDGVWAVAVSLGVGLLFSGPSARMAMGFVSIALLLALAFLFLRGAWSAWRNPPAPDATSVAPPRFDSLTASFALGATMALTSPWNVAFWLAAMGRPELAGADPTHLLTLAAGVIAGAATWGLVWASATSLAHKGLEGAGKRWWTILVDAATALLMLYFAAQSAMRLWAGA